MMVSPSASGESLISQNAPLGWCTSSSFISAVFGAVALMIVQVSSISKCGLQWDVHQLYDCEGKYHAHSCDWSGLHTS